MRYFLKSVGTFKRLMRIEEPALIPVIEAKIPRYISAQDYLDARESLVEKIEKARSTGQPIEAYLAQLATLHPAFLRFCENEMEFSRDFARKSLRNYIFREYRCNGGDKEKECLIDTIVKTLSSKGKYFTHGRMITIENILEDEHLKKLKTKSIPAHYICWNTIEALALRAEVFMGLDNTPGRVKKKLFQATDFMMICCGTE